MQIPIVSDAARYNGRDIAPTWCQGGPRIFRPVRFKADARVWNHIPDEYANGSLTGHETELSPRELVK